MGYKTELQSNNADLQTILNKVNALPEAGGGGGGGSATVEILPITVTNNGMSAPGENEYILSNDNLHSSSRSIIVINEINTNVTALVFYKENSSASFKVLKAATTCGINYSGVRVDENSIRVYGVISTAFAFITI